MIYQHQLLQFLHDRLHLLLEQFWNIAIKVVTLFVFQLEISGKLDKDEHPLNIKLISVILLVFHFDISGNDDNDEQL